MSWRLIVISYVVVDHMIDLWRSGTGSPESASIQSRVIEARWWRLPYEMIRLWVEATMGKYGEWIVTWPEGKKSWVWKDIFFVQDLVFCAHVSVGSTWLIRREEQGDRRQGKSEGSSTSIIWDIGAKSDSRVWRWWEPGGDDVGQFVWSSSFSLTL